MLGRKTAKIKCHSHPPCPGYMLSTSPMMLTLTTSAAVFAVFVRFFSTLSSFPNCTLWREVTLGSPYLRDKELCSIHFRIQPLHKLFEIGFCFLPQCSACGIFGPQPGIEPRPSASGSEEPHGSEFGSLPQPNYIIYLELNFKALNVIYMISIYKFISPVQIFSLNFTHVSTCSLSIALTNYQKLGGIKLKVILSQFRRPGT